MERISHLVRSPTAPLALVWLLGGCAASISTHIHEPVQPARHAEATVLAVMPGTTEAGSEWLRPQTMIRLVMLLDERFPAVQVLEPQEVGRRLTQWSLADEYASMLEDFERAGVVDPGRVTRVAHAVGATHLLQVRAGYAGEELLRESLNLDGSTFLYETEHQTVYAVARLWSPSGSAPEWEAVVRSESEAGPFSRRRDASELVDALVASLVERMPVSEGAPAPHPAGSVR